MSSNVGDRRGYVGETDDSKAVVANTEQLVVLNRLLDEWLHGKGGAGGTPGGDSGGGSGSAYRFTGGGAVAGPGGSGGMGGGTAGAGGGTGGLPGMPSMPGGGGPGGVLGRLRSPIGGGGGQDSSAPEGSGPAGNAARPHDQFTPGNQPFGPGNKFTPPAGVGPGRALPQGDQKDALYNPITSKNFMGGVGANSASRGRGAHQGEDWGAPVGTPVHAVKDGTIERISKDNFGTPVATIRHDDGTYTRDMHLQPGSIRGGVGDRVTGGQQYASSGTANGVAHLHHERWQGSPYKGGTLLKSVTGSRPLD